MRVDEPHQIERTLKWQLFISTILMTPVLYGAAVWILPSTFNLKLGADVVASKRAAGRPKDIVALPVLEAYLRDREPGDP